MQKRGSAQTKHAFLQCTVQFHIIAPDSVVYNIVALYAPDGDNAYYLNTIHGKARQTDCDFQILIGDFNVSIDPWVDRFYLLTNQF